MAMITGSFLTDLLLAVLVAAFLVYWYFTNNLDHWDKLGVRNTKRGILLDVLLGRRTQAEGIINLYKSFPGERYFGMFRTKQPLLIIKDVDLIHHIMVKDFAYFQDRASLLNKKDPISGNLFNLRGKMWRAMRYKLTPTFTTGKLKGMFDQISKCGDNMVKKISELSEKGSDIEAKTFLFEFTSEVISSCAFGLQFEVGSQEFETFKSVITRSFAPGISLFLKFMIFFLSPALGRLLNIRIFIGKQDADYFLALIKAASKYRKQHNIKRNDYLQLLLTLQEQEENGTDMSLSVSDATDDDAPIVDQMKYIEQNNQSAISNMKLFTDENVCANSVIFLVAGSESTSGTISITLMEIARHPEVQHKLQQEVDEVLANHGGQWSYQAVKDMTYLDQVVQEAQRFYPIISLLERQCTKPYKLPGSDLVIQKGDRVGVPVIALHMDPQYYPEPELFKPERFEGNNFKPNPTYLPFGDGPRICIAMRFAVMEVKTAIARIMANYSVKLSPKTKLPIKMNPRSFVPVVEGGLWLKFERRKSAVVGKGDH